MTFAFFADRSGGIAPPRAPSNPARRADAESRYGSGRVVSFERDHYPVLVVGDLKASADVVRLGAATAATTRRRPLWVDQWAIRTGNVMDCNMVRVAPPRISSRARL